MSTYINKCPRCAEKLEGVDKTDFFFVLSEHYFYVHHDESTAQFYGNMAIARENFEVKTEGMLESGVA